MSADPTLTDLYRYFPASADEPRIETISAEAMPEPYRGLLVHTHHMTVTVERFYDSPVDVSVLAVAREGHFYCRKIMLSLRSTHKVVQFGIVEINLDVLDPIVRAQIEEQKTPLGRVLIQNNVLRNVRPVQFFRAFPTPTMCEWFGMNHAEPLYGRVGVITTNHEPAIKVAEILAPIPAKS